MDILNEKIEGLVKKVEKSGSYGILKKVYDKGMVCGEQDTDYRTINGMTPRVNSFVTKSSDLRIG